MVFVLTAGSFSRLVDLYTDGCLISLFLVLLLCLVLRWFSFPSVMEEEEEERERGMPESSLCRRGRGTANCPWSLREEIEPDLDLLPLTSSITGSSSFKVMWGESEEEALDKVEFSIRSSSVSSPREGRGILDGYKEEVARNLVSSLSWGDVAGRSVGKVYSRRAGV